MIEHATEIVLPQEIEHTTLRGYVIGFVSSVVLTFISFLLVMNHVFPQGPLIATILVVAFAQFVMQLVFFLHLGTEATPWKLYVFVMMIIIVLIIVVGSLWIMNHLDTRMSINQQEQYMNQQAGL